MAVSARAGFVHYATFPDVSSRDELIETITLAMDARFEVIELSSRLGPALLSAGAETVRGRGGAVFISAGPEFVRTPRSLCETHEGARSDATRRALELVDLAAELGAENLMLVSGADPGPDLRSKARAALRRSVEEIAGHRTAATRITLEAFPRDSAPAQMLGPTTELLSMLDDLDSPRFGATVDLSHLAQLDEDVLTSVGLLARRSSHVHLSTCVIERGHWLDGDQHPSFDEPGVAVTLDVAANAVRALAARGGDTVISIECRRHNGEDGHSFVRTCAGYWERAVGHSPPGAVPG